MPNFPPSGGIIGPGSGDAAPGTVMKNPLVMYVSPTGNDSNTGTGGWVNAFEYIDTGIAALNAAGGGTLEVAYGSKRNKVTGLGVYLRRLGYDVGVGGAGWVDISTPITIRLVPGNSGANVAFGQGTTTVEGGTMLGPELWVAGCPSVSFENWAMVSTWAGPACRYGLSSPLPAWANGTTYAMGDEVQYLGKSYSSLVNSNVGHQPNVSPSQWANIRVGIDDGLGYPLTSLGGFTNCSWTKSGVDGGPALDIGTTFWNWFTQCTGTLGGGGTNELLNCAVRYFCDPIGGGIGASYLQYWDSFRTAGGGIYCYGTTDLNLNHVTGENMTMPAVIGAAGSTVVVKANDVISSDTDVSIPTLRNDGNGMFRVTDCGPAKGNNIKVETSDPSHNWVFGNVGENGSNLLVEQQDSSRRSGGPSAMLYQNAALGYTGVAGSLITGRTGIANGAKRLTASYPIFNGAIASGDQLAWGLWVKYSGIDPTDQPFGFENLTAGNLTGNINGADISLALNQSVIWTPVRSVQRGEWTWFGGWFDCLSSPGSLIIVGGYSGMDVSPASVIHIPAASAVPRSELAALAYHLQDMPVTYPASDTSPVTPSAGTLAMQPGQKLAFWDTVLSAWKYLDINNGAVRIT